MTKALQRKFIRTAMVAVTALLVVLLGSINLANWWQERAQTDQMLQFLLQEDLPPADQGPSDRGPLWQPFNADTRGAARFFQIFYDQSGQVVRVDVGQIATVSESQALAYADQCQGQQEGAVDRFRFCRAATRDGQGEVLLFLDVSDSRQSILVVLLLSVGVGLACWLGTFFLVALLSRRAIAPVVRGMEKQRQFVTNAGHEIKTPLAIIQANTEALELHQGQSKWSRNIRAQTIRLTGLMENLLTLARMDEARLPPPPEGGPEPSGSGEPRGLPGGGRRPGGDPHRGDRPRPDPASQPGAHGPAPVDPAGQRREVYRARGRDCPYPHPGGEQASPAGDQRPHPGAGGGSVPAFRSLLPGRPRPEPEERRLRHRPVRRPGHCPGLARHHRC